MAQSDVFHAAYVLQAKPWQETSALAEVFCRESGRVSIAFRGVRRGGHSKSSLLQPFQPVWVSYGGRHELRSGRQLESRAASVWLSGNALISGFYLNELLVRLLQREDAHPRLFDAYEESLALLYAGAIEPCLRIFERKLLAEIGYEIRFDHDANGEALVEGGWYCYRHEEGFVRRSGNEPRAEPCFSGGLLMAVGREEYDLLDVLRTAKQLFRTALAPHLGSKPLVSRSLFRPSLKISKEG
ncbi:Recombinational DNA repair protein (RecF pathway) [gamma proteobacterium HdN1]|nr:Recombinational DNA repair protein (RecF pathway) [gamma proteobacterium HdN1]